MDNLIRSMNLQKIGKIRVTPDQFVELYNAGNAILLDVRYPFETDLWGMKFGIQIPLDQLPDNLDKIPKDKIVVCACPQDFRSNIASTYLMNLGYDTRVLVGGLLALTDRLKSTPAKDLKI